MGPSCPIQTGMKVRHALHSRQTTPGSQALHTTRTLGQRVVSGGLLTVIGINTLAPALAPQCIPQGPTVARDVVEHLIEQATAAPSSAQSSSAQSSTAHAGNAVTVRMAQMAGQSRDARQIFADVDARLQQVDRRSAAPLGTAREAALETALVAAGIDVDLARAVAHGSQRAEQVARGVAAIERAVDDGRLDPTALLLGGASLVDRLSNDVGLEAAFVVGFALAPHLNASARLLAEATLHSGEAAIHAFHRHHQAVQHLKYPRTGVAIVDGAGFVGGSMVELVTTGLAFFGPGPALGLMKGGEPALVLAEFIAAKTAIAGTEKNLAAFTTLPQDASALVAGFLAGCASHATVDAAMSEAHGTVDHVRSSSHALSVALEAGDLRAVHAALHEALSTATPAERALWGHVLRSAMEHGATGALVT